MHIHRYICISNRGLKVIYFLESYVIEQKPMVNCKQGKLLYFIFFKNWDYGLYLIVNQCFPFFFIWNIVIEYNSSL